jgi:hypothetical protein
MWACATLGVQPSYSLSLSLLLALSLTLGMHSYSLSLALGVQPAPQLLAALTRRILRTGTTVCGLKLPVYADLSY